MYLYSYASVEIRKLTFWELTFWEVDILGVGILGVDILGVDILRLTQAVVVCGTEL